MLVAALTGLCACTSSQQENMDRPRPAYMNVPARDNTVSASINEPAVLIISPISGGRYKHTYASQAEIDAILFGKGNGAWPKPIKMEVMTPDGWKNWDTNRAEQAGPAYPPQGVGSADP